MKKKHKGESNSKIRKKLLFFSMSYAIRVLNVVFIIKMSGWNGKL